MYNKQVYLTEVDKYIWVMLIKLQKKSMIPKLFSIEMLCCIYFLI